jgi:hypothetical protein
MAAVAYRSGAHVTARLIQRARHAEQTPTRPADRKEHAARLRESEDAIKRWVSGPRVFAGVEL